MSSRSDLSQLLALRKIREERAQAAVSVAASHLKDAERGAAIAIAEIERHDRETGQQEQRFFAAMGMRPVSENELGRSRDLLGLSDRKRESLVADHDEAARIAAECATELAVAQAAWRQRVFERDKLAEAGSRVRQQMLRRSDAATELEAEEMVSDRVRTSC